MQKQLKPLKGSKEGCEEGPKKEGPEFGFPAGKDIPDYDSSESTKNNPT
jgi:hypothetical protein